MAATMRVRDKASGIADGATPDVGASLGLVPWHVAAGAAGEKVVPSTDNRHSGRGRWFSRFRPRSSSSSARNDDLVRVLDLVLVFVLGLVLDLVLVIVQVLVLNANSPHTSNPAATHDAPRPPNA